MISQNSEPKQDIFQKDYWNRPDSRARGDSDEKIVAQSVGFALTNWELTDEALASVFIAMTSVQTADSYNAVRRAYGSIHGNAGRRTAVQAAAEVHFSASWENKEIQQSVKNVINAVQWASRLRDDIAHGVIWSGIKIDNVDYGCFLMPLDYNTGRTFAFIDNNEPLAFMRAQYRYTSEDIDGIAKKFGELLFYLHMYVPQIAKRDGRIPLVDAIMMRQAIAAKAGAEGKRKP